MSENNLVTLNNYKKKKQISSAQDYFSITMLLLSRLSARVFTVCDTINQNIKRDFRNNFKTQVLPSIRQEQI